MKGVSPFLAAQATAPSVFWLPAERPTLRSDKSHFLPASAPAHLLLKDDQLHRSRRIMVQWVAARNTETRTGHSIQASRQLKPN